MYKARNKSHSFTLEKSYTAFTWRNKQTTTTVEVIFASLQDIRSICKTNYYTVKIRLKNSIQNLTKVQDWHTDKTKHYWEKLQKI